MPARRWERTACFAWLRSPRRRRFEPPSTAPVRRCSCCGIWVASPITIFPALHPLFPPPRAAPPPPPRGGVFIRGAAGGPPPFPPPPPLGGFRGGGGGGGKTRKGSGKI